MSNRNIHKLLPNDVEKELYESLTSEEKLIVDGIGLKKILDMLQDANSGMSAKDVAALFVARRKMQNGENFEVSPEATAFLKKYESILGML